MRTPPFHTRGDALAVQKPQLRVESVLCAEERVVVERLSFLTLISAVSPVRFGRSIGVLKCHLGHVRIVSTRDRPTPFDLSQRKSQNSTEFSTKSQNTRESASRPTLTCSSATRPSKPVNSRVKILRHKSGDRCRGLGRSRAKLERRERAVFGLALSNNNNKTLSIVSQISDIGYGRISTSRDTSA